MPRMAPIVILLYIVATAAQAQSPAATATPEADNLASAHLDDPWSALEPKIEQQPGRVLERKTGNGRSSLIAQGDEGESNSWWRTIGALAAVVGLIVFLSWGYRAMAGGQLGLLNRTRCPGLIEVVSRTALTPRQSMYLVRVGNRMILVGQTAEQLRTLDVIDDSETVARLAGQSISQQQQSSTAEFRSCLDKEESDYTPEPEPAVRRRPASASSGSIDGVRRGLQDAIRRIQRAATRAS